MIKATNIATAITLGSLALFSASCEKNATSNVTAPSVEMKTAAADDGYPMKTCPVSGEELGEMGSPVIVEHGGTTVKLCCKSCVKKFNADPEKYTAMVRAAKGS